MLALLFSRSRESTISTSSHDGSLSSEQPFQAGTSECPEVDQPGDECLFQLIRSPVMEQLVDMYFEYCHNRPYSFFHEGYFRRSLARKEVPDYLLLAVVATTTRFSESLVMTDKHEIDTRAAICSWRLISPIYLAKRNTDIRVVQTVSLLSIFDFTGTYLKNHASFNAAVLTLASCFQLEKPATVLRGSR